MCQVCGMPNVEGVAESFTCNTRTESERRLNRMFMQIAFYGKGAAVSFHSLVRLIKNSDLSHSSQSRISVSLWLSLSPAFTVVSYTLTINCIHCNLYS